MTADDPVRFAVGTFTRLPVPPPTEVDATVAGRGLALAPAVGALIGLVSGALLLVTGVDLVARLLSATLVVALAAWITRGLHWDGLADVADGLGSAAPPERAREIMRRSDIGPFGGLALGFTIALQVLSIAQLPAGAPALAAWVLAVTLGVRSGGRLRAVGAPCPFRRSRPDRHRISYPSAAGHRRRAGGLGGRDRRLVGSCPGQALCSGLRSRPWGLRWDLVGWPVGGSGAAAETSWVQRRSWPPWPCSSSSPCTENTRRTCAWV